MQELYEILDVELYAKMWNNSKFVEEQVKLFRKIKNPKRVLDVATGLGTFAKYFVEINIPVIGIDFNEECLIYANKNIPNKFNAFRGDCLDLKFNQEFDTAISCSTVAYIEDIDTFFKGVYQSLNQNGQFFVTGYLGNKIQDWQDNFSCDFISFLLANKNFYSNEEKELLSVGRLKNPTRIDSMIRSRNSLEKVGFKLSQMGTFYNNTSYYLLANKQ